MHNLVITYTDANLRNEILSILGDYPEIEFQLIPIKSGNHVIANSINSVREQIEQIIAREVAI